MGNTLIKVVITVALQKDICPQGNTYPRKEVLIVITNRTPPTFHKFPLENDLKKSPFPI
jgi:hypothetical protein